MNLLILIAVAGGGLFALWLIQTLVLIAVGARPVIAWPLRHESDSLVVRWTLKAALQCVLFALLVLPPWLTGESPWDYHAERLSAINWRVMMMGAGLTLLLFSSVMLVNWLVGWISLESHKSISKVLVKLGRASLTPLPLAIMEELVFRGIVLEQLLRTFPQNHVGQGAALTLSAALFASVHFLRHQKQVLLPAFGLFVLGWTLGLVYIADGHTIWVPAVFHAAGVWFIQMTRPFASYHGPAWLIGYRSYPICGVFGVVVMTLLTSWALMII